MMIKALLLAVTLACSVSAHAATDEQLIDKLDAGKALTHEEQQQVDTYYRGLRDRLAAIYTKAQNDLNAAHERLDEPAMNDAAERMGKAQGLMMSIENQRYKALAATHLNEKKQSSDKDLLGGLASTPNAPKGQTPRPAPTQKHVINADIANYGSKIKAAIESQFYTASSYAGKTCSLKIQMNRDGKLTGIKAEGGDPDLCAAAINASRKTNFPPPPSDEVYEVFKNAPIDFKP